jgi:hypothetical protein
MGGSKGTDPHEKHGFPRVVGGVVPSSAPRPHSPAGLLLLLRNERQLDALVAWLALRGSGDDPVLVRGEARADVRADCSK